MPSKILTGALKANPENKRILMSRAMVWYEMKKYPEVLNDYSEVIRIDSNYIYCLLQPGYVAGRGRREKCGYPGFG